MHPPIAEIDYPIDWNRIPIDKIKQNLIPFFSKDNLDYLYEQAVEHGVEADEEVADTIKRAANSSAKGYLPWWKTFRTTWFALFCSFKAFSNYGLLGGFKKVAKASNEIS